MPATEPIMNAPGMPTLPAAGVMATKPATAPEAAPSIDGLPLNIHSANVQVSTAHAVDVEARLYERLFSAEVPGERTGDAFDDLNRESLEVLHAKTEAALADTPQSTVVQFERLGYFHHDQIGRASCRERV